MPFRNRIKELRKSRDWSMEKLADVIGGSTSTVNRLENGSTELVSDWLPKLSAAFGVPWTDIVWYEDDDGQVGLVGDAVPFTPSKDHPLANVNLTPNHALWEVISTALNAIGIELGDIIIVDISPEARADLHMGDAVVVQIEDKSRGPNTMITYVRQYIEPDLFITNSHSRNELPFSRRRDKVQVIGKIKHRFARIGKSPS